MVEDEDEVRIDMQQMMGKLCMRGGFSGFEKKSRSSVLFSKIMNTIRNIIYLYLVLNYFFCF